MRLRRILISAAAGALIAGTAVVAAPSALADSTWSGSVTTSSMNIQSGYPWSGCAWTGYGSPLYSASTTFTPATSGTYAFAVDTASINGHTPPTRTMLAIFKNSYSEANCIAGAWSHDFGYASISPSLTAGTTYVLVFLGWDGCGGICTTGTFAVSIPDPGIPAAAVLPPPPWIQGYARATKDTPCIDGWIPSWEQWPNDGKGGYVCTRSIPSVG